MNLVFEDLNSFILVLLVEIGIGVVFLEDLALSKIEFLLSYFDIAHITFNRHIVSINRTSIVKLLHELRR